MDDSSAQRDPHLWRTVSALGVAQIVSWGSLFYGIAVLGPAMRDALRVSDVLLFGSFTAGLFVSGLLSPWIGRMIDRRGGTLPLALGSVTAAIACAALASAQGPATLLAGWLVAGAAMAAVLYDPAFAALHGLAGRDYRSAVTGLTLFGGFASTVFWPLSHVLLDRYGWRATFACFAGFHLLLCFPLHALLVPSYVHPERGGMAPQPRARSISVPVDARFWWLALAFSLAAFIASALSAHRIGLLVTQGLSAGDAVWIGALIGPMQVVGRILEFRFGRGLRAVSVGVLAFTLMAAALAVLNVVNGLRPVAVAYALLYGWSNGVMTIVRGTVPAELFGRRDFGALLGRLAQPQFILKSFAPLALTFLFAFDPTKRLALYGLAACGIVAWIAFRYAVRKRHTRGHLQGGD